VRILPYARSEDSHCLGLVLTRFVPQSSYFFRFSGPSLSIDTACSSSFAAIQSACNYLWRGDCDTAIAGGTNVLTNPDNFAGLDRGHFLSTTGESRKPCCSTPVIIHLADNVLFPDA
jgi:hypothetical protein